MTSTVAKEMVKKQKGKAKGGRGHINQRRKTESGEDGV
jgi:hypothetical protein